MKLHLIFCLCLVVVHLHVNLFIGEIVKDSVLAALLVEAGLHELQPFAHFVKIHGNFLESLSISQLRIETGFQYVEHSLLDV